VALAGKYKVPFTGVVTNGQRLDEQLFGKLTGAGLDEIVISLHGVYRNTYERFMVNASYEKLHNALEIISSKQGKNAKKPALRINYTVNHDNLTELAAFFTVFGKYPIKTLQIRKMFNLGNTDYQIKDFSDLSREYNEILEILSNACHMRGITLLAGKSITSPMSGNQSGSGILPLILRHIRPQKVWQPGFLWEQETYRQYCKRIKWRGKLLKSVIKGMKNATNGERHLNYEVEL
jgi:MoaA/NifB/PqqE/SkfB family radical SAM enzyme